MHSLPSLTSPEAAHLVNIRHVKGFQRNGDKAVCLIENAARRQGIPVSRSRIGEVREALRLA